MNRPTNVKAMTNFSGASPILHIKVTETNVVAASASSPPRKRLQTRAGPGRRPEAAQAPVARRPCVMKDTEIRNSRSYSCASACGPSPVARRTAGAVLHRLSESGPRKVGGRGEGGSRAARCACTASRARASVFIYLLFISK